MLIVFKSGVCADVVMFAKNGREILQILDKNPDDQRGVITVEQLPNAIAALDLLIKEGPRNAEVFQEDLDDDGNESDDEVGLALRAVPILELFERSLAAKVAVTWGI